MRFATLLESLPSMGGIVFPDGRRGTAELRDLAFRAARDLRARGVHPGDAVVAMLENSIEFVAAWFGAALAGARFVPLNTRLRGETLRYIVQDAKARVLVADASFAECLAAAGADGIVEAQSWLASLADGDRGAADAEGGLVIYTSGTTGRPKAVEWTSETQALHAWSYGAELVPVGEGEHCYSCLPLFHVTCMGVAMSALIRGATVHIDPRFSVSQFWPRIAETRAVFFPYVGSILSLLLKDERSAPTHGVRSAMGAAAPAETFSRFQERFGIALLETYGQTELGAIWLANHARVAGSVGRGCPRADFRLVPVAGIDLASELQVRPTVAHAMMAGYRGNPAANAEAYADGWYRTRDLMTVDAEGNYYFGGRLADCVRRRGENVSCFEVEQAVLRNPRVLEAAVVGVDSELGEQDLALYYVPRPAATLEPPELHAWCRAQLADFMVPRYVVPVSEFPKTQTQRVQKGILHDTVRLRGGYDAEKAMKP